MSSLLNFNLSEAAQLKRIQSQIPLLVILGGFLHIPKLKIRSFLRKLNNKSTPNKGFLSGILKYSEPNHKPKLT
jgi:hypothetical protein